MTKPHKGAINHWYKVKFTDNPEMGLGYYIVGRFVDHPKLATMRGHTSWVVAHDTATGEIETRNSRYTLIGPEQHP